MQPHRFTDGILDHGAPPPVQPVFSCVKPKAAISACCRYSCTHCSVCQAAVRRMRSHGCDRIPGSGPIRYDVLASETLIFFHFSRPVIRIFLPDDLFDFFRLALGWVVTIYAAIITAQSLWGWYVWLAGSDKYISLIRRYVIVHGLRLRFRAFWGDVIICLLLSFTFVLIWQAHGRMDQLKVALDGVRQADRPPTWRVTNHH
jgi:hypothetical protein